MDESSQLTNNHDKTTKDLKVTKTDVATLNHDMTTIITKVQTDIKITTDDLVASSVGNISIINNDHLQNMGDTFDENMDLMQQQYSSSITNIQVATTKAIDEVIDKLHSERDVCIVNISIEILDSPTTNDTRNVIIVDITQCRSKSLREINETVTASQITCESHITRMNSQQVSSKADDKDKYNAIIKNFILTEIVH